MLSFPLLVSLGLSILLAAGLCILGCRVMSAPSVRSPSFPPANPTRPMVLVRPVLQCEIPRTASGDVDLVALGLQDPNATDMPAIPTPPAASSAPPAPLPSTARDLTDFAPAIIRGSSPVYRPTVVEPPASQTIPGRIVREPLRALLGFKSRVLHHQSQRALARAGSSSDSGPLPSGPEMSPVPSRGRPSASGRASLDRGTQCSLTVKEHKDPESARSKSSSPAGRRAGFAAAEVHYFAERGFAESNLTESNALASVRT